MGSIGYFPKLEGVRQPLVRPAYRILQSAWKSASALFDAVETLKSARRQENDSPGGRNAQVENDILRSAIVFTSAGLDASMKRLVNDVGRSLVRRRNTGARHEYEEHLKREMKKPGVSESFRQAVLSLDPEEQLLEFYLAEKTKASFQGSKDLKVRVRQALGISKSEVSDSELEELDAFFVSRNRIVHDMDLKDPSQGSVARIARDFKEVAKQCNDVFLVAVKLIRGAAEACKH